MFNRRFVAVELLPSDDDCAGLGRDSGRIKTNGFGLAVVPGWQALLHKRRRVRRTDGGSCDDGCEFIEDLAFQ